MAATSASRSWAAFARRAVVTGAVATVGMLALAIPASAHTPDAKAGCDEKTSKPAVSVKAVKYELEADKPDSKPNSVTVVEVTDEGEKPLVKESFGVNLAGNDFKTYVFDKLDGRVDHTFKVTVVAFNDKEFKKGWSKVFKDLKSGICDDTTPPSEPSSPPSEPSSPPSNPSSAPPVPQPAPAPAVGAGGELASTGASIALPLAIGALLLVGGGVLLLVMRKRGKA